MSTHNSAFITTVAAFLLAGATGGCAADGDIAADDSDLVNQGSRDVATLRVSARESINGNGQPGFRADECSSLPHGGVDCTSAMEKRFGLPAIHQIVVRGGSQFFCHAMHVETVSRQAAFDASDGIGFFYRGEGDGAPERFVPKDAMKKVRDVVLKNGEAGVVHEFVGLASCWRGSASSSSQATYELKPYMRFSTPGETYKNWETGSNWRFQGTSVHLDRTRDLLR